MLQSATKIPPSYLDHPDREPTSLASQVGNTPLLGLKRIAAAYQIPPAVQIYAKAEWFNPSGSVKDRPALNIIRAGEHSEKLKAGGILLDSTSGNMGISYAMFGAAAGYKVRLTLPQNASRERIAVIQAFGAELIFTDPLEGSDGAIREARRLAEMGDGDLFYANQYDNPANWQAHYFTTANEIIEQTSGGVTHFVAGLGTSGTFTGTSRRLKEYKSSIHCLAMQPDSPFNGLEGLKHIPTSIRPGIYDSSLADSSLEIGTEEAYEMARKLATQEGLFVGFSAAAAVLAALKVARDLSDGLVVTVLPDSGLKYLSERFWSP